MLARIADIQLEESRTIGKGRMSDPNPTVVKGSYRGSADEAPRAPQSSPK